MSKPDRYFIEFQDIEKIRALNAQGRNPEDADIDQVFSRSDAGDDLAAARKLANRLSKQNCGFAAIKERTNLVDDGFEDADFPSGRVESWTWDEEFVED